MPRFYQQMTSAEKRAFTMARTRERAKQWARDDIAKGIVGLSRTVNRTMRAAYNEVMRAHMARK